MTRAGCIPASHGGGNTDSYTKLLDKSNIAKHKNVSHTEPDIYTTVIRNCSWTRWLAFLRTFPVQDGVKLTTLKLHSLCDGARTRDRKGYSRYDVRRSKLMVADFEIGNAIHPATLKEWFLRLVKYRKQLIRHEIIYPDICFEGSVDRQGA